MPRRSYLVAAVLVALAAVVAVSASSLLQPNRPEPSGPIPLGSRVQVLATTGEVITGPSGRVQPVMRSHRFEVARHNGHGPSENLGHTWTVVVTRPDGREDRYTLRPVKD